MLEKLCIENIAVIEQTEADFTNGFTVLTGETGAGKSILIGSIGLLMGQRVSKDLVREGAKNAFVSAVFSGLSKTALKLLAEYGFEPEEDRIIISREIDINGKGSARINGKLCTVALLKELSVFLVDIHGQNDNHFLMQPENHINFLNEFAECEKELAEYQKHYSHALDLKKELHLLQKKYQETVAKKDLLVFQLEELESAQLKPGEDTELSEKRQLLQNAARISEAIFAVRETISSEEAPGAIERLGEAAELLRPVSSFAKELGDICSRLYALQEDASDLLNDTNYFISSFEYQEQGLEEAEERLGLIHHLCRKFNMDLEQLILFQQELSQEITQIEVSNQNITKMKLELSNMQGVLEEHAKKLSQKRKQAAILLDRQISDQLSFLEMPKVLFQTSFSSSLSGGKTVYTASGCDKVEFLIATNAGETPKPLVKIASGGELSRIMLALKSVLKSKLDTDTLVFDEIDTGVSGKAARKIGMRMREIAQGKQVLCVTHLAQIASLADKHILIQKDMKGGRAYTTLQTLDYQGRKQEIARIISGIDITDSALQAAEELLYSGKTSNGGEQ